VRNRIYYRSRAIIEDSLVVPSAIRNLPGLLLADCSSVVLFLRGATLRKQFGKEYERYRGRVPRWIPKVSEQGNSYPALAAKRLKITAHAQPVWLLTRS